MVARILSSLLIPDAVPFITETACLNAPATSRSAKVEITPFILNEALPKGSTSKPYTESSSSDSAASAASRGSSSTTSGMSSDCTVGIRSASGSVSRSSRARSWATCWSTIHAAIGSSTRM